MRTAWILLTLAASAVAQTIPELEEARTRNLLASPNLTEKAWGAYFAGRSHAKEWTEPLIAAMREAAPLSDAPGGESLWYVAALFDAAIEAEISVPADVLEPYEHGWLEPVVILLARQTDDKPLLAIFERELRDGAWLAVNDLLLTRRSKPFLAQTLSRTVISHFFTITDPGEAAGRGEGVGGGSCGDSLFRVPQGFPPTALYNLAVSGQPLDVLLARGPRNSYYHRTVNGGWGECGTIDRQEIRVGDLAELDGISTEAAAKLFQQETRVEFHDDASLRDAWDAALHAQELAIRDFVRKAQIDSVAGMHLKIEVQLDDRRSEPRGPTPPLTPHEFVID